MKKNIPKNIMKILDEVNECLEKIYGDKLKEIILYGSYARGDFTDGSDIDLLILLQDMRDPCAEIDTFSGEIGQIDLKYDTLISIIPLDEPEFRVRRLPLIMNVKNEGILI